MFQLQNNEVRFFHDTITVMYARGLLTPCYLFNEDFARCIVDLQVIKTRTSVPSETTQTRDDFRDRLLKRDARCVWTGIEPEFGGVGIHIIPYKWGSEVRSIIFCWEYISSSPFLRLLISVASADHSKSTKVR